MCYCVRVKATEVTTGPAESNGSLPLGGWLKVTCGLTASTLGSAPVPTLDDEYEKLYFTLPYVFLTVEKNLQGSAAQV